MTNARELTEQEIPEALAEAQGWTQEKDEESGDIIWVDTDGRWTNYIVNSMYAVFDYNPSTNNDQYNELTLNPEIHAGMIDVLDEWFSNKSPAMKEMWKDGRRIAQHAKTLEWYNNPEYLQDIRLWQLRACVEYLRHKQEG